MTCPICNHELLQNESFCPQCGFEIHILPEEVSDAVKAYENARVSKFKTLWKQGEEERKTILELTTRCEKLQHSLTENQEKLESTTNINKELVSQLSVVQHDISQLQAQVKDVQNALHDEQSHRADEERRRKEAEQKCKDLEEELTEVKHHSVLVGIMSIRNTMSDAIQYVPIYTGLNTFGTAPDDKNNHHEIKLRVRGTILRPKHFSVEIGSQTIIKPIDDAEIANFGTPIPSQGIVISTQHRLFISDVIEIHISKL